ncbi:MAG: hypothetical protein QXK86_08400 [Candidatus Bathyarchaeia archaeon]
MREIYDKRVCEFRIVAIKYTEREIEQLKSKVRENIKNFTHNMNGEDIYVGNEMDVAVGMLLAQHLRRKLGYPFLDCEAHEEAGYGLPEFSIYYNQDTRSFCGKWTYSENPQNIDESGVFFALISSEHPCYRKIEETINGLLQKANVAIAILAHE